jgi:chorismate mutase/prephenate dehydratase
VNEQTKDESVRRHAKEELDNARRELENIDRSILELIKQRSASYESIWQAKRVLDLPILDAGVEQKKLVDLAALAEDDIVARSVTAALEGVMRVSRMSQYQRHYKNAVSWEPGDTIQTAARQLPKLKVVATQGTTESYSSRAASYLFPNAKIMPARTFEAACREVAEEIVPVAVLPLENSTAGTVEEVYRLIDQLNLYIIGTVDVPIRHCLCAIPGTKLSDIRTIISHPQALSQCSLFIQGMGWQVREVNNTAYGARDVAEINSKTVAALASPAAAAASGLEVLQAQMSNVVVNTTRFAALASKPIIEPDANIVSLIVRLPHHAGSLANMLNIFSDYGLNLLKIKSSPVPDVPWEYNFHLDLEGRFDDQKTLPVLFELMDELKRLRFVGWYKNRSYVEKEN